MAWEERPGGLGGLESPGHVPGRAGGAGGGQDTMCSEVRPAVCPPQKKAAKLGCFGLKIPGGNRESLKGKVKKKNVEMGKENESCCPRAST